MGWRELIAAWRTDRRLEAAAGRIAAACHGPAWDRLNRRTLVMSSAELRGYLRARCRPLVHEHVARVLAADASAGRRAALVERASCVLVARLMRDVQTMPVRLRQRQAA